MSEGKTGVAGLEAAFGLELSAEQKQGVRIYIEKLRQWNAHVNLTAIERVEEHLRLNFFEAFWAAREFLEAGERVADVGSGAGFPGLAMKIYRPALGVTLIEPNFKKAVFLKETARTLGLRVSVFIGKGEEFGGWDEMDVAAFRALRPPARLLRRLAGSKTRLLLFEGQEGLREGGLRVIREARVPLSEQRWVRLAEMMR
jgi:16S rRNA (guanine(527)-N(7))-methyltransferase RsmG